MYIFKSNIIFDLNTFFNKRDKDKLN